MGQIDIACVKVPCPPLFSLEMAKLWQVLTDHNLQRPVFGRFNHTIDWTHTPFVDIFDVPGESRPDIDGMPSEFFLEAGIPTDLDVE